MNIAISKEGLSKSFSNAAIIYDKWAAAQRKTAEKIVQIASKPECCNRILDIGCGTGSVIDFALSKYPESYIHGIDIAENMISMCKKKWSDHSKLSFKIEDIEKKLPENKYDLIFSNCCLHWLQYPYETLKKICNLLNPKSEFVFSLINDKSFLEVSNSVAEVVGDTGSLVKLPCENTYYEILKKLNCEVKRKKIVVVEEFATALEALKSISKIGASLKYQEGYKPLTRSQVGAICNYYENNYTTQNGLLSLTYNITIFQVGGYFG